MFTEHGITRKRYMLALSDGVTPVGDWQARNVRTTPMGNVTIAGPEVTTADSLEEAREIFRNYAIATGREDQPTDSEHGYGGPSANIYIARHMDALNDPHAEITPDTEHAFQAYIGPRGGFRIRDYYGSPVL